MPKKMKNLAAISLVPMLNCILFANFISLMKLEVLQETRDRTLSTIAASKMPTCTAVLPHPHF